jgi:hypothetical protein
MQHDPDFTAPPNLDDMLAVPASQGAWRMRAIAAGATLVAVCVLLAEIVWPRLMHSVAGGSASYTFHLASNITWASFTVTHGDTRTTFAAHTAGQITLHTGPAPYQVVVTATAPPFNTQQCHLTIPPAKDDTCVVRDAHPAPLLAFAFGLSDLPATQQEAVAALVTTNLGEIAPATIIPAGGHYVLGTLLQHSYTTAVPLATSLTTAAAPAKLILDASCLQLCAAQPPDWTDNALDLWHARLFVTQEWHFARTSDGAVVGATSENLVPHAITFDLLYDAGPATWSLPQTGDARMLYDALIQPLCADGNVYVQSLYFVASSTLATYNPNAILEDHQLNGCLITLMAVQSSQHAIFLWHTAQLYAVNGAAHAVEPSLVQASPQDLAALG